ncbi:unnamed protein product [Urochloa decumbens]|uniref:FBD domain-containing protein n=1 Tax=Urochloa decumbens TaxID=240449 RepID=A0ABC9G480_9POAL
MQLRSGRRLASPRPPPPQGDRHYRRHLRGAEDRISSLPEDLLLQVLARLKSAAEAARAGAVSRPWRGLWTELPELTFFCVKPRLLEAVLAQVTRPRLDLLDITLVPKRGTQVSSLLRAAARLAPQKLIVLHHATTSLALDFMGFHLSPPPSGEFTALRSLTLETCCIDIGALLPLCPCLRVLNVYDLIQFDTVKVHSALLEELSLKATNNDIRRIDIAAPMLKEVTVAVDIAKDFSLSFSAPVVKIIEWDCECTYLNVGLNTMWKPNNIHERKKHGFHVVSLNIAAHLDLPDAEWSIQLLIAQLPSTVFSVMELDLKTEGHAFGSLLLHLLWIRPVIQSLKVVLARDKVGVPCPVDCPCEQHSNWRSETVPLTNLEVVEIQGFQGEDEEVDFLKLILRSATVLRRLTIRNPSDVSPSNSGYKKMCSIMKEYPDVEYHVHSI